MSVGSRPQCTLERGGEQAHTAQNGPAPDLPSCPIWTHRGSDTALAATALWAMELDDHGLVISWLLDGLSTPWPVGVATPS